ncbi:MAG: MFS transporter [Candidatus Azobacteroides sp.]|nr:MFS transporter [Candidatus Azobacteroides sp.]
MKQKLWNKNFINSCIANFLMASSFHLLMPVIPIYLTDFLGVAPSRIGIVLSSYSLGMLLVRPFSGYIIDVFDRKKVFLLALLLFVATFFGYLFAVTVGLLIILRFLHGLFWGVATVSSNTIAIDIIPSSRRAEGVGYFGMNMNLAMAIAPFIAIHIFESFGFYILIFCAIFMGMLAIGSVMFIKTPYKQKLQERPPLSFDRFILIKGLPVFFNQLLVTIGWGMLVSFAALYGKEINIPNPGMFFLFVAAGLILARITSGRFVDKGYLHIVAVVALSIITLSLFSFYYYHTIFSYCLSAFFIGIGYGTMLPAFQTTFINMAPHDRRGTANSTYLTAFDFGMGAGMLLGGYISGFYSTKYLYLTASILSFFSILFYLFISRKVYEKNKLIK